MHAVLDVSKHDVEHLLHDLIFACCLLQSVDECLVDLALSLVLLLELEDLLLEASELLDHHLEGSRDHKGLFLKQTQLLFLRQVHKGFVHQWVFMVGE